MPQKLKYLNYEIYGLKNEPVLWNVIKHRPWTDLKNAGGLPDGGPAALKFLAGFESNPGWDYDYIHENDRKKYVEYLLRVAGIDPSTKTAGHHNLLERDNHGDHKDIFALKKNLENISGT